MNLLIDGLVWLGQADNWTGTSGLAHRAWQHLWLSALAVVIACVIAVPIGMLVGHTRKGAGIIGGLSGAARAIPTLGVLTLVGLFLGIGIGAPLVALVILAVPSILAGTYSGIQAVDRTTTQAATAVGMNAAQVLCRVELPLALPVILGGVRAAALQVISTATLAAYTADVGLGRILFHGLKMRDYSEMLGAAVVVAALALATELLFVTLQRLVTKYFHL